ncbi:DUF1648 domain-containing protein [Halomarina rubra]|uniref:DUF1648 domain-containing protein n=1 Tax=Halomarina rubra TaxID=2071873 RepID=A0ABD6B0D2_9EURY|nr:DUF1648 domain-containing protein [Halomarina rubra]
MAPLRTVDHLGVVLAALTVGLGIALWGDLPAEMAIHFDTGGEPDNLVPKPVAVVLVPALMVGVLGIMNTAARADPPASPRVFRVTKLWTLGILAYVHGYVLAWNLGYELPPSVVLGPVLGSAAVLVVWALRTERRASVG